MKFGSSTTEICSATNTLTAGPDVLISSGANVAYHAPQIILKPGFQVALGGQFTANNQQPSASVPVIQYAANPQDLEVTASVSDANDAGALLALGDTLNASQIASTDTQSPHQKILAAIEQRSVIINGVILEPVELTELVHNDSGQIWVFSTRQTLTDNDTNSFNDVYRYDVTHDEVVLVSRNQEGISGNGESLRPDLDATGDLISFQSSADDLVADEEPLEEAVYIYNHQQQTLQRFP